MPQPTHPARHFRYQPFYCEENAWWLCAEPALGSGPRGVLFIAAPAGHCPFMHSRAAAPGEIVWWDYHCVCVDGSGRIWDLDSRLPLPCPGLDWLKRTFPFDDGLPPRLRPRFRLVPAAEFRLQFSSDRRHMRNPDGSWLRPPPPWPVIGDGWNLAEHCDMQAEGPGELMAIETLRARLNGSWT